MRTCAIMQPTYMPWLGYFDLIRNVDIFVILDHVQFSKQSWQQRNRIRDKNGELLLTIPVKHEALKEGLINSIQIDRLKSPLTKHLKAIQLNYSKSKNYQVLIGELSEIYRRDYELLIDLNLELIKFGCRKMKLNQNFVLSSELEPQGGRVQALVDICQKVDANHYVSPVGAQAYLGEGANFKENGIKISYQSFVHPVYQQINFNDFISHLSFIDYLFNC